MDLLLGRPSVHQSACVQPCLASGLRGGFSESLNLIIPFWELDFFQLCVDSSSDDYYGFVAFFPSLGLSLFLY